MKKTRTSRSRNGFTLLELLAVLLIVAILASMLLVGVRDAYRTVERDSTRIRIESVEAAVIAYENEFGDYPSSTFPEQGAPENATNQGAEALVVALWSKGWEAGRVLSADDLVNTDGDHSAVQLTDFGTKALFETGDGWDNPIAYFHHLDYGREDPYVTFEPETGSELDSVVQARRNAGLGRYYAAGRFQLISPGEDGRFGTEDDLRSFAER